VLVWVNSMNNTNPDENSREHLEIKTIRCVHETYRQFLEGKATSFKNAAEHLGFDASVLLRRVLRFEKAIQSQSGSDDFKLFERGRGKNTKVVDDLRVVQVMRDVAELVDAYGRVTADHSRRLTVRFAGSLSACSYLSPILSNDESFKDIEFEFTHAKPNELRQKADHAECDFVLVVVSEDFQRDSRSDVVAIADLPMALLCPRGHWTEYEEFSWNKLGVSGDRMVLLKEEPDRYPMPRYPVEKFPCRLPVHRLGSTSLSHSLVMDGGAITISLPQFFSARQREFIHIVRDPAIGTMRLALLAPKRTDHISSKKREILGLVREKLKFRLKELENRDAEAPQSKLMQMYHITHTDKLVWLAGSLIWQFDDDNISGIYKITPPTENCKEKEFLVRGHVTSNKSEPRCHVACRAVAKGGEDEFVFDATCHSREHLDTQLTGIWVGRPTWHTTDSFSSFLGNVVITVGPKSPKELNRIAEQYRNDNELPPFGVANEIAN